MSLKEIRATTHPSFRFIITFDGNPQGVFTECTLPVIEWEMEEIKEGGQNTYTHQLPGRRKGARLTLKNGVGTSELMKWYTNIITDEKFEKRKVEVALLDAKDKNSVMTWTLEDTFPIKWSGPQLKSSDNSIAIQTLELACGYITLS